jgi:hypothetical protein
MQLTRATERRTAVVAQARRKLNLALGVAGTAGGAVLLGANVTYLVLADVAALPFVPLAANVALILGGVMFLRELRRGGPRPPRSDR